MDCTTQGELPSSQTLQKKVKVKNSNVDIYFSRPSSASTKLGKSIYAYVRNHICTTFSGKAESLCTLRILRTSSEAHSEVVP